MNEFMTHLMAIVSGIIIGVSSTWIYKLWPRDLVETEKRFRRVPEEHTVAAQDREPRGPSQAYERQRRSFSKVRRANEESHVSQPRPYWNPDQDS